RILGGRFPLSGEQVSLFDASVMETGAAKHRAESTHRLEQGRCVRQRGWLRKISFQGRGLADGTGRIRSPRGGGPWRGASVRARPQGIADGIRGGFFPLLYRAAAARRRVEWRVALPGGDARRSG